MNPLLRKTIIAGNWKMNKKASEVESFCSELCKAVSFPESVETVLCVPFPLIPSMMQCMKDTSVKTGAQDVSSHDVGAYTGEVSADMLADLGVGYCVIGHSERRAYVHETDWDVNQKLQAALSRNIHPIVCVGESLEQREMNLTMEHIAYQIKAALFGVPGDKISEVVIAYEPIWAIGTGKTATAEQAEKVCEKIRSVLAELYDTRLAESISILYGGSMNAKNAKELLSMPDIDGGLIGGASLKPLDFASIIKDAVK